MGLQLIEELHDAEQRAHRLGRVLADGRERPHRVDRGRDHSGSRARARLGPRYRLPAAIARRRPIEGSPTTISRSARIVGRGQNVARASSENLRSAGSMISVSTSLAVSKTVFSLTNVTGTATSGRKNRSRPATVIDVRRTSSPGMNRASCSSTGATLKKAG